MKEHILIADDEKEILSLLRLYLENAGYRVSEALDGEAAYSLIQNEEFDLAILDIMMPKLNGYALIRRIREHNNLPIIILSAKKMRPPTKLWVWDWALTTTSPSLSRVWRSSHGWRHAYGVSRAQRQIYPLVLLF